MLVMRRESPDEVVDAAFRRILKKAHPDKGGSKEDVQNLTSARAKWHEARGHSRPGRPTKKPDASAIIPASQVLATAKLEDIDGKRKFEFRTRAILLTYHGLVGVDEWDDFVAWVESQLAEWGAKHWCATLELCKTGRVHLHLMLQFFTSKQRDATMFAYKDLKPNVSTNDLCGEGVCGKKLQQSIDRGFFYAFVDKIGTVMKADGSPYTTGNYFPAWVADARLTYQALGKWPETLWKQYKITSDEYEKLLFLTRDGVVHRKRNLAACLQHGEQQGLEKRVGERTKRIRNNPDIYKAFPTIPVVATWLDTFKSDAIRYAILIVFAPSRAGKTEYAKSLFQKPLELKIGQLEFFPDRMREFRRGVHDGIVLDDVRNAEFLVAHQEKLQGKYDGVIEFASTAGGTCAYSKDLFGIPVVATINKSTKNLHLLHTDDWLGKEENRVVVNFPGVATR